MHGTPHTVNGEPISQLNVNVLTATKRKLQDLAHQHRANMRIVVARLVDYLIDHPEFLSTLLPVAPIVETNVAVGIVSGWRSAIAIVQDQERATACYLRSLREMGIELSASELRQWDADYRRDGAKGVTGKRLQGYVTAAKQPLAAPQP